MTVVQKGSPSPSLRLRLACFLCKLVAASLHYSLLAYNTSETPLALLLLTLFGWRGINSMRVTCLNPR
jgi:hypothetical protein